MAQKQQHPHIYEFLKKFQEDPSSRVFAPLAEAYRKAGLLKEALDIAREGLKIHPTFLGGRVALARVLFDQKNYSEVISELVTLVRDAPDNLVAQRLLADSYLMSGQPAAALHSYKMLLFFSPQNEEVAKLVQELETRAYEKGGLLLRTDLSEGERSVLGEAANRRPRPREKAEKVQNIERLQVMLQNVERYRMTYRARD